jgi:hypothetical protein
MNRSIFTIIFFSVVLAFAVSAQAGNVNKALKDKAIDKQVVTDEMEAEMEAKVKLNLDEYNAQLSRHQANVAKGTLADGDTIGFTLRDFSMNTCMGRKIAYDQATGNLHAIFTQWQPSTSPYHEFYNFFDPNFNLWLGDAAIDPALNTVNTRSGRVLIGPNGEAWVFFHNHEAAPAHRCYLYIDGGPGFYSFTQHEIAEGRFAGGDYKDGGQTVFSMNDQDGDFTPDRFFRSTDGGVNWTQSGSFLELPVGDLVSNVELYSIFNPVNGDISVMYANDNPSDLGEAAWWATSSDLGDNWNTTRIYEEETVLPTNVWYLIENFSQYMTEIDENGVTHFVFNGYGFKVKDMNADSTLFFIYPVVYWNDSDQQFIELTDSLVGRNPKFGGATIGSKTYPNILADGRSGNAIGNAFPAISIGPNGVLAAIWEQAELADDSTLVIGTYPDGTPDPDPLGIYATDIWCAVSGDYGHTWSAPFYIDGDSSKCERSPSLAREIEFDGSNYTIHYVYMYDPDPNQDLPNDPAYPAAWVYGNYDITSHIPVGIDPVGGNVAADYNLAQNYPNPFNPSTTITFTIQKRAKVTLDVYNTLGQKVKSLLNGVVSPGDHKVEFVGDDLTSGIYFYQLTVDNFKRTKKMVLMK